MSNPSNALIVIQPRRPTGPGWKQIKERIPTLDQFGYPYELWTHLDNGIGVISAVEVADEPGKLDLGPEYHLSVSAHGRRCSSADATWALQQFELTDAKEDNHVPGGNVRNFWRPVADHLSGYECPCVDEEPAIREDKGDFIWRGTPG